MLFYRTSFISFTRSDSLCNESKEFVVYSRQFEAIQLREYTDCKFHVSINIDTRYYMFNKRTTIH